MLKRPRDFNFKEGDVRDTLRISWFSKVPEDTSEKGHGWKEIEWKECEEIRGWKF